MPFGASRCRTSWGGDVADRKRSRTRPVHHGASSSLAMKKGLGPAPGFTPLGFLIIPPHCASCGQGRGRGVQVRRPVLTPGADNRETVRTR